MALSESLLDRIQKHEGFSRHAYLCPTGHLTIGYGTRIDDGSNGIDPEVANLQLLRDLNKIDEQLTDLDWYMTLDQSRREVMIEMAYQMGFIGLMGFKKMIAALKVGDWDQAAEEMINSRWYSQTPKRAVRLAGIVLRGFDR